MNSFTLTAVGQLARNPELVAKGSTAYTRFCLVGNDYAGKDEEGAAREVVTSLWFVAFGPLGEAIARQSRKGDQLFVEARVRASNWTDKQGEKQYDHSFVVQGFRFGAPGRAKREERDARRENGHGLQRNEDRTTGRDRSANNGAGLGGSASGGRHAGTTSDADSRAATAPAAVRGPVVGANEPVDASDPTDANEPAGADESARAHEATGARKSTGAHKSVGAHEPPRANEGPGANSDPTPTAGADLAAATAVGPVGRGGVNVGAEEADGAGDGVSPVATRATKERSRRVASAGATASRASEKSGGSRPARRAAASAA